MSASTPAVPGQQHEEATEEHFQFGSAPTVVEPDSVTGDDGRTYHGYKQGAYVLPNDAVCL